MVSYDPLFKTMEKKGMKENDLFKKGFKKYTYRSILNGNYISTNTLNQLCKILDCPVEDILVFIKDSEKNHKN